MKKLGFGLMIACIVAVLAACGGKNENAPADEIPEILAVDLTVPEKADPGEKVVFAATVTQGNEKVKDADEVEFEIWAEGKKDESEMIKAENKKNGTYELEKSFNQDGIYTVQVHVTARGQHNMPKKTIAVGEATAPVEESGTEHGEQEEHAHSTEVSMHFMKPEDIKAGTKTDMVVHLQNKEAPLEKADVRFEIWNEANPDKHEWIDASETKAGEYSASYDFPETGEHTVRIHVENDEGLHEHEEHAVTVK